MTEALLELLTRASLWFSATLLLIALLRPSLRRLAGATAQYQLWLLLPAVLLAAGLAALQPQRPLRWQIELPAEDLLGLPAALPASPPALVGDAGQSPVPALLLLLWLLGVLGCALVWILAQRRLLRARRLPAGGSAALIGAWRPRLRLSADFRQRFPAPERRLILLHERLHAERGDTRWLLLALALLALQWFNPLAWWALGRLRADMELACDAALLRRRPDQLKTYRLALLRAQPLALPPTATPCSSHPLIERLQMLPTHTRKTTRRWLAACLVAGLAGLAYAAQPVTPAEPPAPPALQAPAAPALPAVSAVPAVPALLAEPAPEPPPPPGYSKLRVDLQLSMNGEAQAPVLLLQTFNELRPQSLALPGGGELLLKLEGRPHRDDERLPGQSDLLLLQLVFIEDGKEIARPRLISKDGVPARIEFTQEGGRVLRLDLLPRVVTSRLHDSGGALAELRRDIEDGRAPGIGLFKR